MYNSKLFDIEKNIYLSVKNYSRKIIIKQHISVSDINLLMQKILDEHPELFYFDKWNCVVSANRVQVEPIYLFDKKDIKKVYEDCDRQIKNILSKVVNLSKIEQIKLVHDILIRNISYYNLEDLYIYHSIVGPLIYRKAVCDGYSRLYKLLLDRLGFPCIVVRGRGFNKSLIDSESHLWNMINYQGKWYHIDVTYDHALSLHNYIRYDYFLVDDSVISIDHYYNKQVTPKSYDDSMNPYYIEPSFSKEADIIACICNKISLKKTDFILRVDSLSGNVDEILNSCINVALNRCNYNNEVEYYYNPSRKIVHIRIL